MKSDLSGATRLILGILAVYGAADLLTNSDRRGPHEVLFKLRAALGVYDLDADGEPETELGRLFACPFLPGDVLGGGNGLANDSADADRGHAVDLAGSLWGTHAIAATLATDG